MTKSIVFTFVAGTIFLSTLVTTFTLTKNERPSTDDLEKNTIIPAWIERAKTIKAKMNESADYCDDFYNYVCGGYVNSTFIPDNKDKVGAYDLLRDKVVEQLNRIIDRPSQQDEPKVFRLAKNLYKLCMNRDSDQKQNAVEPFLNYLEELGGWPVLKQNSEWNETLFNWKKNVAQLFGNTYWSTDFFEFKLNINIKNNTQRVIQLKDYTSKWRENYLFDQDFKTHLNYMINISVALGSNRTYAENELAQALIFEKNVANLIESNENYRNMSSAYNPMTLGNLTKKYPYFEWKNYLNHILSYSNISVDDDEIIIVKNPNYFDKIETLLNATSKRTQANLVIWKIIQDKVYLMNENVRKIYENYIKIKTGRKESSSKWIKCTRMIYKYFPIAINALYVREYVSKDIKYNVANIVKNIHDKTIEMINESSWLDQETKLKSINKGKQMNLVVAYPDELLNNSMINDYYKDYDNFEMNNNSYIGSRISLDLFENKITWSKLKQKYNLNEWHTFADTSSDVNAWYNQLSNSIYLTAGILQGEFFNNELPKYVNYGALGSIIGHEIMHAFDDLGKQFDSNGNIANWWSETTNKEYQKKAQCIIDQYGNYTVKEINMTVNGIRTQGENIADNEGIRVAYWAYNDWLTQNNNNELEKKFPLFNFTARQIFWISYANMECSKTRFEIQKTNIKTDFHSPPEFRVNGVLSNLKEFSNDFKCPESSKMNPKIKCTMW